MNAIRYAIWLPHLAQAAWRALPFAIGLDMALDVQSVTEGGEGAQMIEADRGDMAIDRAVIARLVAALASVGGVRLAPVWSPADPRGGTILSPDQANGKNTRNTTLH